MQRNVRFDLQTPAGVGPAFNPDAHLSIQLRAQSVARKALVLIIAMWLATIALHELEVGGDWDPVAVRTWILIAAWLACFAATYKLMLTHLGLQRHFAAPVPVLWANRWVKILSIVAAVGAVLIIFDFAILRGYGFVTAAAAIRAEETNAMMLGTVQGSPISGLGRLLIPSILPAYILAISCWAILSPASRLILLLSSLITIGEQVQFEGGRFFITAAAFTALACYFAYPAIRRHSATAVARKRLPIVRLALLAAILLSFFSYVFVDRILQRGDFFWSAYLQFAGNFSLQTNYERAGMFDGPLGPIWFSVCMLWVYITQGINELDLLLSLRYFNHAHGLYQMPHIAQIALVLFGADFRYDVVANLPTVGTYATFYGHNFIDFGNTGAIASGAILGALTARAIVGFASGRLDALSIQAPILLILCLFSPIISLVTNLWPAMAWAAVVGLSGLKWQRAR